MTPQPNIAETSFSFNSVKTAELTRYIEKTPFIPSNDKERNYRCHLILQMQSQGLKKRIEHTNAKSVVIGISGGLDSCLAFVGLCRSYGPA